MPKNSPVYATALEAWKKKPGDTVYLSCADTAKLIRAKLKATFPGVKFSVRSSVYSGGASIDIKWTDGPTEKLVDAYVAPFAGAGFDGMTDYKYSVGAWLMPDGTAETRSVEAHYGTDGETIEAAKDGAIAVRFGADFVFTRRDYSAAALERTAAAYAAKWGDELSDAIKAGKLEIDADGYFGASFKNAHEFDSEAVRYSPGCNGRDALMQMAARRMLPCVA